MGVCARTLKPGEQPFSESSVFDGCDTLNSSGRFSVDPRSAGPQSQKHLGRHPAQSADRCYRVSPGRASRRSSSTRSTPKASGGMSSRSPPTRASFSSAWRSPMSTKSSASRLRSRSSRRTRHAIRARRSPPPPNCTISSACCSRVSAGRTARTASTRVQRDTVDQVADAVAGDSPRARAGTRCFPVERHGRHAEAPRSSVRCCGRRASTGCFRTAACSNSRRPNRCWISISRKPVCVLVDRLAIEPATCISGSWTRVEICYREAGEVIFEQAGGGGERLRFNEKFACKTCGMEFRDPEPSLFSFNNPIGACPRCQGFGNTIDYDMDLVIPDTSLSLEEGAVDPWTKPQHCLGVEAFQSREQGQGPARRSVLRFERRKNAPASSRRFASSSPMSKRRNTRSTCACS